MVLGNMRKFVVSREESVVGWSLFIENRVDGGV